MITFFIDRVCIAFGIVLELSHNSTALLHPSLLHARISEIRRELIYTRHLTIVIVQFATSNLYNSNLGGACSTFSTVGSAPDMQNAYELDIPQSDLQISVYATQIQIETWLTFKTEFFACLVVVRQTNSTSKSSTNPRRKSRNCHFERINKCAC